MVLDKLVNQYYDALSDNDLYVIKVIHDNIDDMKVMKIQELAELSHISISSIHRLAKKLGFDGYSDLKSYIKLNDAAGEDTQDLMELLEHDIKQTLKHLDQLNFDRLNRMIDEAPFIYIYGTGTAQLEVANDVQRQLLSLYKRSMVLKNERELMNGIEQLADGEILLIISLSGETKNFEDIIHLIRARNVQYISVTTLKDNLLAQNAMFNIYVNSTPFYLFNGINNSSFLPYHIVFDVILRKFSKWKNEQADE
ncbi:RpiR family transcriptional regulator [Salinicoccus sediminis]|uniref:RpiR family transcriptional regulator n=1 Tax=Salinicoccus sediminis TaxID=1432562 RepID=A0A0M2SKC7_9STAP|nr:MurR/RpiR family transcriptional regulator [Salinicoccus sediminis]KKK35129.1 RpiR family transcriptional regulator [Salinicoccus sediminis]